ncbi:hypothetical protein DP144_00135 [Clostridium tetani]|uniref:hypothetical protein n=1 Tax=Clostridium tetani TaxID=1513 RepID=UPI00100A722D|nr:hypothetical protein [Clostridium tetani]RXM79258.1 hypothetical protein DP154_00135 [Clostridium tetani]RYV00070.1 hypothetical protein DP144_00135 [Clostridium tetani]
MFLKINNLINETKEADYKGISLNNIIPFSQVYDFDKNFCILRVNIPNTEGHPDIEEISKDDYAKIKKEINQFKKIEEESNPNQIEKLQKENEELKQAVAELSVQISNLGGI